VPSVYATLTDDEWEIIEGWYAETEATDHIGEINVPAMCLIQGLVSGGALRRIVQLGHYFGYSTLLLGFMLRSMGARPGLFSVDIDPQATAFTQRWIRRAGLGDYVTLRVGDSADPASVSAAARVLGGPPQLILVDSSHQYGHTLRELSLWVPVLPVGAIMLLHDTTPYAQQWDSTKEGGVLRAIEEWLPAHPEVVFTNLNAFDVFDDANEYVYKDACGMGILQKVAPSSRPGT
jgi:predicted O-methyltransferase YrrM